MRMLAGGLQAHGWLNYGVCLDIPWRWRK